MTHAMLLFLLHSAPQADPPPGTLLPSPPSFAVSSPDHALVTILDDFRKITGLKIATIGKLREGPLGLKFPACSPWEALDRIADAARARLTIASDGALQLVADSASVPTASAPFHQGYFRLQPTKITTQKDLTSGSSSCTLAIDLYWLPSLKPLFIDNQAHQVHWKAEKDQERVLADQGGSLIPVDGRFQSRIEITLPAPPRKDLLLESLSGRLQAIVPTRFLDFPFPAPLSDLSESPAGSAVRRLARDDIVCQVQKVLLDKTRWSIQVALAYPPGGKELESFQAASLVVQNEIVLLSAGGMKRLAPSGYVIDQVSSYRALVTYHFTDRPGIPRGNVRDWTLIYRAPARIVEVTIPFRFRNIPLP